MLVKEIKEYFSSLKTNKLRHLPQPHVYVGVAQQFRQLGNVGVGVVVGV